MQLIILIKKILLWVSYLCRYSCIRYFAMIELVSEYAGLDGPRRIAFGDVVYEFLRKIHIVHCALTKFAVIQWYGQSESKYMNSWNYLSNTPTLFRIYFRTIITQNYYLSLASKSDSSGTLHQKSFGTSVINI